MKRTFHSLLGVVAVTLLTNLASAGVGADATTAAQKFLAALSPAELATATMKFDDPARLDWHNIPKASRKGLQLRDMSAEQQELARNLLRVTLSESGYKKATTVMSLENNLFAGEEQKPGSTIRDPQRYFLTIFGKPELTGSWGWSLEGHHLSLNFVIRDGAVISHTPSFWGACPATVKIFAKGGPPVGTRLLMEEEQSAFDLLNLLQPDQRSKAIIADMAPADYRAAGKPQPIQSAPEGIAAAELTPDQKQALWSLIETYSQHHAAEISASELQEIKSAGNDRIYFAWAGGTEQGIPHSYRVQGPTFVLELVNYQADPAGNVSNHIHSVWRSLKGDFAIPLAQAESK